jgi:hypothetical protein
MSTQFIKVLVPQAVVSPRGARWAAEAAVWISRALFVRTADGRTVCAPGLPRRETVVRSAEAV